MIPVADTADKCHFHRVYYSDRLVSFYAVNYINRVAINLSADGFHRLLTTL